jgi:Effector Associated Constant Component 1
MASLGDIRISVGSAAGHSAADEIEDLDSWLRGEPELAGRVRSAHAAPRPGEMGTITDALIVAVGAQGALTALAGSLRAWFAQPRRSKVSIKLTAADGTVVEIDADRVRTPDLERVLARSLEASTRPKPEERKP